MLTLHWSTLLAVAVGAVALVLGERLMKSEGMLDFSPLLGCGVFLLGAVCVLVVLLARAWGWI